ncbi:MULTISPECIES: LysR substrate-binding domain-containing protein [unclassified Ensifer]|jgi:DNA-binding transcriptional LysR family regulator|uniref:LysR substrate-binding domain-containing protein n=1 Tax=unclassified Ensifer TaxID=2633371 RepID=UPI000713DEE1|nr:MULTISPECIES: LysR substrate-binding domain-containing protein [unclassified Ensifer]KQX58260.1 LysR family transcriptional regulator [Ensifer sp. Root1298]KQX84265.1 LysR family transcriptional regulator [Ensifer sp. Root1312]KRC22290.1 LysR family transcriptional regulator [Ensifer sp. Root74]KRD77788.1 LysR family transcriptional regulator [Ensifer sp. Root954]MBD9597633.1 LysR family transcriptional regulator [Ensifer sp. ENS05]
MVNLRKKLPPLTALTAFEAAARLSSFTRAAMELGVTQAAISRQIHLLEEDFGFPLFRRLHRKIELTDKGRLLSAAAGDAFNLIADTVADLRSEGADDELAIAATISFSHFWLLPRIAAFSRAYPEIKLRIITQDARTSIEASDVDLAIRYGTGTWPDGQAEFLFEDEVFPICSADYLATVDPIRTPGDLINHPLITSDIDDPTWTGWDEWLAAFSVKAPKRARGLRCSFYTEAIYAAMNGQGIALGWNRLVSDLIRQTRLVRLTEASIRTRAAYFVVVPARRPKKESGRLFIEWLREVSAIAE